MYKLFLQYHLSLLKYIGHPASITEWEKKILLLMKTYTQGCKSTIKDEIN